jgi:hypothetical protein
VVAAMVVVILAAAMVVVVPILIPILPHTIRASTPSKPHSVAIGGRFGYRLCLDRRWPSKAERARCEQRSPDQTRR